MIVWDGIPGNLFHSLLRYHPKKEICYLLNELQCFVLISKTVSDSSVNTVVQENFVDD